MTPAHVRLGLREKSAGRPIAIVTAAQKAGRTYIDMGLFRKNTASVMSWCKFNPSDSVMAAIERAVGQK